MDKIANGFTVPFSSSRAFKERPSENGWNFLEMAGKSAAGIRKMKDFSLRRIAATIEGLVRPLVCYQTSSTHNEPSGRFLELFLVL